MSAMRNYSVAAMLGKLIAFRLLPGMDLLEGIRDVCEAHGIRQGSLVSGTGSLRHATFMVAAPDESTRLGAGYSEPIVVAGPVEVLGVQGVILEEDHKVDFHVHGAFANKEGKVFGGHVVEGENPVLVTLDGVVAELIGPKLGRRYDEEVGARVFHPAQE